MPYKLQEKEELNTILIHSIHDYISIRPGMAFERILFQAFVCRRHD